MSICSPCTATKPILYCSTSIHVGDWIAGSGAEVFVWYKNTATGRIQKEDVTTGVDGKVAITFGNKMESSSYELWINTSEGTMNDQDAFYLPNTTTSVNCITVKFNRAFMDDPVTVSESTIEAE